MIYLISDPHGGESMKGLERFLEIGTDSDLLIILGDLGIKFEDTKENEAFTEWFLGLNMQIAIVEGNHENHAYLNAFPTDIWCGGEVNRISDTIVRLKRGNIYHIEGNTFWVMGGCKSSAKWKEMGLWFDGEEPTEEELSLGYSSLSKYNHKIDYVLTHKYANYKDIEDNKYSQLSLEGLTKYIDENVVFSHWYSGHWHINKRIDARHTIVYDEPISLAGESVSSKTLS